MSLVEITLSGINFPFLVIILFMLLVSFLKPNYIFELTGIEIQAINADLGTIKSIDKSTWSGSFIQYKHPDGLDKGSFIKNLRAKLDIKGTRIFGEFNFEYKNSVTGKEEYRSFKTISSDVSNYNNKIIRLSYIDKTNNQQKKTSHGYVMLELSDDGDFLRGGFVAEALEAQRQYDTGIVSGEVILERQK